MHNLFMVDLYFHWWGRRHSTFQKKNIVLWMKNKTNYSSFLERRSHSWSRHYISISSVLNQLRERFSRHGLYIAEFFSRSYGDVYLMSTDMPSKLWPQPTSTSIPHVSIVFHSRLFTRKKWLLMTNTQNGLESFNR